VASLAVVVVAEVRKLLRIPVTEANALAEAGSVPAVTPA
jgi:hypothetical protein